MWGLLGQSDAARGEFCREFPLEARKTVLGRRFGAGDEDGLARLKGELAAELAASGVALPE